MSEESDLSDVGDFYSREASHYDADRWRGPIGEHVHETYLDHVRSLLEEVEGESCLEVGCGTGRLTLELAARGLRVTALDISDEMLEMTRRKLDAHHLLERVELRKQDVRDLQKDSDEQFDLVCAFNVLNHVPNHERALDAMVNQLRTGGTLLLGFPSLYSLYLPYAALVNSRGRSLRKAVYTRWLSAGAIRRYLRNFNVHAEEERAMYHAPLIPGAVAERTAAYVLRRLNQAADRPPVARFATLKIIAFRKRASAGAEGGARA